MSEVVIQRGDGLHLIIQRGLPGAPGQDGVSADWNTLPNKPGVIAAGDTVQEARDAIGLGSLVMSDITDKQGKVLDDLIHLPSDTDLDGLTTKGGYFLDADELSAYAGSIVWVGETTNPLLGQIIVQSLQSLVAAKVMTRYKVVTLSAWQPWTSMISIFDVLGWYDSTTAEAPNAVINADGTFSRSTNQNPLLVVSGVSHAFVKADVNKYARFTSIGAKTATFDSSEGFTAGDAFHITNRAASGNITISGTGVTFNAPKGGTLVLEPKDTVTVKFVSPTEADVMGSVVAA